MGWISWFLLNFDWIYHEGINYSGGLLNHTFTIYHFVNLFDGGFLLFFFMMYKLLLISLIFFYQGLYFGFQLVWLDKFVFSVFLSMDELFTIFQVNLNLTVIFHPSIVDQSLILFFEFIHLKNEIKRFLNWPFHPLSLSNIFETFLKLIKSEMVQNFSCLKLYLFCQLKVWYVKNVKIKF